MCFVLICMAFCVFVALWQTGGRKRKKRKMQCRWPMMTWRNSTFNTIQHAYRSVTRSGVVWRNMENLLLFLFLFRLCVWLPFFTLAFMTWWLPSFFLSFFLFFALRFFLIQRYLNCIFFVYIFVYLLFREEFNLCFKFSIFRLLFRNGNIILNSTVIQVVSTGSTYCTYVVAWRLLFFCMCFFPISIPPENNSIKLKRAKPLYHVQF